jgi:uncharacterized RDD family membrane protein YckC
MVYCKNCGNELPEGAAYCPKCGAAVERATVLALAFWGERFLAWLIDIIIVGIAIGIVRLFAWIAWPSYVWASAIPNWIPFVDVGFSSVVYFFYWTLMDTAYSQSIGKMIMRIRVAQLNGERAGMVRAALESVGKAFLLPIDCILGWVFYPRKRQRMFNYLSGTIVIRASG